MTLSPPVSPGPTGLLEPPLSPGAPVLAPEPPRSIEAEMVRMGLMTPDQVAATMREESETGRPFTELAVERGHVSAEHMAKIAKPVLPTVQRETQPAPPEQRAPIFADTVLPPMTAVSPTAPVPPVEPLLPPPAPAEPLQQAVAKPDLEAIVVAPEPEPVGTEPEPVAVEPEPVTVKPEPVAAAPESVVAPEPVAVDPEPEPVAVPPQPVVAEQPQAVVEPEPVAVDPEPEPVAVPPQPVMAEQPQAVVEPEPEPVVEEPSVPIAEAAPAAPTPMVTPEPVAIAEPPVAAAAPVQTTRITAHVYVRLSNGERIAAGSFDNEHGAELCAQELMAAIDTPGSWPRVDGRYVRPDAILSIDLELSGV